MAYDHVTVGKWQCEKLQRVTARAPRTSESQFRLLQIGLGGGGCVDIVKARCGAVVDIIAVRVDVLTSFMAALSPPTQTHWDSAGMTVVAQDISRLPAIRPDGYVYDAVVVDCTELGVSLVCAGAATVAQIAHASKSDGAVTHRAWDRAQRGSIARLYRKHFRNVTEIGFERGGLGGFVHARGRITNRNIK